MTQGSADDDLAARTWRLMFDFFMGTHPQRSDSLRRHGLTPNDARALASLDAGEGRPIGELARQWQSDPSNTTWVIDRLEKAGLVARTASARDRRVKLVGLTERGRHTRDALMAEFRRPPGQLQALDPEDLATLERIFAKLTPA